MAIGKLQHSVKRVREPSVAEAISFLFDNSFSNIDQSKTNEPTSS